MAIDWLSAGSPLMIPTLGARTAAQLSTALDGVDIEVPSEWVRCLDEVSAPDLGYPHNLLRGNWKHFGKAYEDLDPRIRARAR
jgi:hypothetical protein